MPAIEGDRPGGAPPSPTNPSDGPPKAGRSFTDPVKLDRAARIAQNALARAGLTLADFDAREHVRAA